MIGWIRTCLRVSLNLRQLNLLVFGSYRAKTIMKSVYSRTYSNNVTRVRDETRSWDENRRKNDAFTLFGHAAKSIDHLFVWLSLQFYLPGCLDHETAKRPFGQINLLTCLLHTIKASHSLYAAERQATSCVWKPIFNQTGNQTRVYTLHLCTIEQWTLFCKLLQ